MDLDSCTSALCVCRHSLRCGLEKQKCPAALWPQLCTIYPARLLGEERHCCSIPVQTINHLWLQLGALIKALLPCLISDSGGSLEDHTINPNPPEPAAREIPLWWELGVIRIMFCGCDDALGHLLGILPVISWQAAGFQQPWKRGNVWAWVSGWKWASLGKTENFKPCCTCSGCRGRGGVLDHTGRDSSSSQLREGLGWEDGWGNPGGVSVLAEL